MTHVGQKMALGLGCRFGRFLGFAQRNFVGQQLLGGLHALKKSPGPTGQQTDELQVGWIEGALAPVYRREVERAVDVAFKTDRYANVGGELKILEAGVAGVFGTGGVVDGEQGIVGQRCAAVGAAERKNLIVSQGARR